MLLKSLVNTLLRKRESLFATNKEVTPALDQLATRTTSITQKLEVKLKDPMQDINREIAIMKRLDHPNIIKLYEVMDQTESDKLYLGSCSLKTVFPSLC